MKLHKVLAKIKELRLRYYIDYKGDVQTFWQGDWYEYEYVSQFDKRLVV